jgi:hypothetical protein
VNVRAALLAGAAALLPATVASAVAETPSDLPSARFAPPSSPLLLTRTLYRTLVDGKVIIVTRRYSIRFTAEGEGYRLDGEQIGAEVDAPAALASLAEIERKRIDKALFPARLDSAGMIREGGASMVDPEVRRQVVVKSGSVIASTKLAAPVKRETNALVGQFTSMPNSSAWPVFLFNPGSRERIDTKRVALPGGTEGEVEVRIRAEGIGSGGLPHRVERKVITRLAGTEKVSREVWTIDPA